MKQPKQLIFGTGSGRCGTKSLRRLLIAQPDTLVAHEHFRFPWEAKEEQRITSVREIVISLCEQPKKRVGDVAYWYLPYVDCLLTLCDSARVICLQRGKVDTVASIVARRYDYFSECPGPNECPIPELAATTPKFPGNRMEAAESYWEYYYQEALLLQDQWLGRFQLFPMEALNSEEGQYQMLSFLGYPEGDMQFIQVDPRHPFSRAQGR